MCVCVWPGTVTPISPHCCPLCLCTNTSVGLDARGNNFSSQCTVWAGLEQLLAVVMLWEIDLISLGPLWKASRGIPSKGCGLAMKQVLPSKTKLRNAVDDCTLPCAAFLDVLGHSDLSCCSGQRKFSKYVLLYCVSLSSFVQYRKIITVKSQKCLCMHEKDKLCMKCMVLLCLNNAICRWLKG